MPARNARQKARPGGRTRPPKSRRLALVKTRSANAKTGPVVVTYAAQVTCHPGCPFYHSGCYFEQGPLGVLTRELNASAAALGATPLAVISEEARLLDGTPARSDLRLHGGGDCPDDACARVLSGAAERYAARGGALELKVWTYTHAWRTVGRASWGSVSVLASCETAADALAAMARGYAAALVVPAFDGPKTYTLADGAGGEVRVVPCPFQTKGVQCVKCRLCLDADRLLADRLVIGFEAHGARKGAVIEKLQVLNR